MAVRKVKNDGSSYMSQMSEAGYRGLRIPGLQGLKGLDGLSEEDQKKWREKNKDLLSLA